MASELDNFNKNIENLKSTVRSSCARVYAALKARELKTLRQLDALRKQCENNEDLSRQCVQNIHINYDTETKLLDIVSNFCAIDFEKLNFDSTAFTLEDYISPNDDHMYSYKTIEECTNEDNNKELEAIEEAAIKEITKTNDCVCYVSIRSEDVSKKFRYINLSSSTVKPSGDSTAEPKSIIPETEKIDVEKKDDSLEGSDEEVKKIDPTDDWLNSIKSQTETEPAQVSDGMEHSTISCTCKIK